MIYKLALFTFFLEYVRPGFYFPFIYTIKLNTILPLIVLVLSVFSGSDVTNKEVFGSTQSKIFGVFFLLLAGSVVTADVFTYSWDKFLSVLGYFFLFIIICKEMNTLNKIKGLIFVLVVCHVILVALNLEIILNPETRSGIESATFLGDGNDLSLSIGILVPLCIFLYRDASGVVKKYIYLASIVILCMVVIGTSSRGGALALIGCFLYMWWHGKKKIYGLFVMGVLAVGVMIYAPPTYFQRIETIKDYQTEGSAQGRITAWKAAGRMAVANPVFGVGSGHFSVKFGTEFWPEEYEGYNIPWLTAHSMYFLALGELGFPGIIWLFFILYTNYKITAKIRRETLHDSRERMVPFARMSLALNSGLIAYMIAGAFLSVTYYPHIFIISALVFSHGRLYQLTKIELSMEESSAEQRLTIE